MTTPLPVTSNTAVVNLGDFAKVGDTIECDVKHPYPHTLSARLNTLESCAYGNDLLLNPNSGWRLRKDLRPTLRTVEHMRRV